MQECPFHLVNVFAETHFGGNPLAVFPKADGLSDEQMQQIAQQFNLSETVFIFNTTNLHNNYKAVANLRIFTPNYELPLAGHPTLGSSFILQKLNNLPNEFVLNTQAKSVKISVQGSHIKMQIAGFSHETSLATADELAKAIGLTPQDIEPQAFWLNSGSPQLLLQVMSKDSLFNAKIDKDLLAQICQKNRGREMICLWFADSENDNVFVRFFSLENGAIVQDSGTGSACANLGAYFILQGQFPTQKAIFQGDDMGRPNRLTLKVDSEQNIFVGGNVIEVGKGEFYLPVV